MAKAPHQMTPAERVAANRGTASDFADVFVATAFPNAHPDHAYKLSELLTDLVKAHVAEHTDEYYHNARNR